MHGSYEALKYGTSLDGLADLTGGVSESISIHKDPTRLCDTLTKLLSMTSIVTATIPGQTSLNSATSAHIRNTNCERLANGITLSVNYRVMSLEKIETIDGDAVQLVRLRNPLGLSTDFIGAWGKESTEWNRVSEEIKSKLNLKYSIEGEFWMTYQDFVKTFSVLEVIHLDAETSKDEPSLRGRIPWHMRLLRGVWRKGMTEIP